MHEGCGALVAAAGDLRPHHTRSQMSVTLECRSVPPRKFLAQPARRRRDLGRLGDSLIGRGRAAVDVVTHPTVLVGRRRTPLGRLRGRLRRRTLFARERERERER